MRPITRIVFYAALGFAFPAFEATKKYVKRKQKQKQAEFEAVKADHNRYSIQEISKLIADKKYDMQKCVEEEDRQREATDAVAEFVYSTKTPSSKKKLE